MKSFATFLREANLYHATYKAHKSSIKRAGLQSTVAHKNWEDSEKGIVYLAKNAEIAHSHAETAEDAPDRIYDSGIIVYKIDIKNLDQDKLKKDRNNPGGNTVEYHGDIPFKHLKIDSEHDT